jgi:hypothetical protein
VLGPQGEIIACCIYGASESATITLLAAVSSNMALRPDLDMEVRMDSVESGDTMEKLRPLLAARDTMLQKEGLTTWSVKMIDGVGLKRVRGLKNIEALVFFERRRAESGDSRRTIFSTDGLIPLIYSVISMLNAVTRLNQRTWGYERNEATNYQGLTFGLERSGVVLAYQW